MRPTTLFFLVCFLSGLAKAEDPPPRPNFTDPPGGSLHIERSLAWQMVQLDSPLAQVAKDWYGDPLYGMPLCAYNIQALGLMDCNHLPPGREIFLPAISVLNCMFYSGWYPTNHAGLECPLKVQFEECELVAINNLPDDIKQCTGWLKLKNPGAPGSLLLVDATALHDAEEFHLVRTTNDDIPPYAHTVKYFNRDGYLSACKSMDVSQGPFERTIADSFIVASDGKPTEITNHWGPEDCQTSNPLNGDVELTGPEFDRRVSDYCKNTTPIKRDNEWWPHDCPVKESHDIALTNVACATYDATKSYHDCHVVTTTNAP